LNAVLGIVLGQRGLAAAESRMLRRIQNDLFDVGADLCVPRHREEPAGSRLRIAPEQARALETAIDSYTMKLEPLQSFILPGGTPASAWLHLARVVCRRTELAVATLLEREPQSVGQEPLVYLNRLSDLLFVMARWANAAGGAMSCGSREPDVQADRRPEADRRSEPPLGGGAPGGFLGGPTPDPGAPAERLPRVDESRSPHESCLRYSSGARTAARRFAVRHFSRLVREPRLAPPSAHSHDRMLAGQESRT